MADVRPFFGLRYDLKRVGSLSQVIAPPYDVIFPEEQAQYLQRSPYNIVRLEGAAGPIHHSKGGSEYSFAANLLSTWIQEGALKQETCPAYYLVEHRFTYRGKNQNCWGLLGRVRLEELGRGQIYPHEATSNELIKDRLLLLRACRANLSPIIAFFQGEPTFPSLLSDVLSYPPTATAEEGGIAYNLWVINWEGYLSRISNFFASKPLYLADGHHRYEAAWLYRQELRPGSQSDHPNFVLMSLFNAQDPGLLVLPVHRLVRGFNASEVAALKEKLELYFQAQQLPSSNPANWLAKLEEEGRKEKVIGFYQPFGGEFVLLTPRWEKVQKLFPSNTPIIWRETELNLLHQVILKELLKIDSGKREEQSLNYQTNGLRAIEWAKEKGELAFLLNPLRPFQIIALAEGNLRLPHKSSYFHPKTPAGLVINSLWD